jgi:hypothetical protein
LRFIVVYPKRFEFTLFIRHKILICKSPFARVNLLQSSMKIGNIRVYGGLTGPGKSGSVTHPKRFGVILGRWMI